MRMLAEFFPEFAENLDQMDELYKEKMEPQREHTLTGG